MKRLPLIIFISFLMLSNLVAQYSTEHYMPPLYNGASSSSDDPDEIRIDLSTMVSSSFNVSVKRYDGTVILTKSVSKSNPNSFTVSASSYLYADAHGTTDQNKGLYFTASSPFYLRVDIRAGDQMGSVSSKGAQGMGKEFFSAHFYQTQSDYTNQNSYSSFISIMATENSTTVSVDANSGVNWDGQPSNTITLNKGYSYVLGIDHANSSYDEDVIGTKITADKDIVVNSGTWSGGIRQAQSSNPRDMGYDQLVPVKNLGTDYLIMEGESSSYKGTAAIIVATEDNTTVSVDGSVKNSDLDEKEFYEWDLDNNNNSSLDHISADKPIMVYYQGYSTDNKNSKNNNGMFLMAPLNASNSSDGANHAHLGDDIGQVNTGSSDGEINYYILQPSNATTTVQDGSSNYSLSSWDNQTVRSMTVDGQSWEVFRKLDDDYTTGADVYFESNKPIYVWYAYGKNNQGYFSTNLPFAGDNTPPTASAQTVSAIEDVSQTITLSGSDADGDDLSYIITSLPSNGTLTQFSGGAISTGTTVSDGSNRVKYISASNGNGNGHGNFNFKVNDGTEDSDAATVTVNVTAVNDEPSFTKGSNQSVNEDAGAQTVSGWASSLSKGSGDPSSQSLTFTVTNNNNSLFSTQPAINSSGVLTYTSATNATGSATVSVVLSDDGGTANSGDDTYATQTFTITVNAVDDNPTVASAIADFTVLEDASNTTKDYSGVFTDVDNDDSNITKAIQSNNNTDLVSASISGNTLTLDYEANQYGTATITVRATSNGETVDDAFVVTVTGVNDEPSFTKGSNQSVNEDAGAQTVSGWASNLSKGTDDPSSQELAFTVTNANNSLFSVQPAISASGVLTYTSASNATGSTTVSVVLADDGGTANSGDDTYATQTFTITVNAVDDAPTVANAIADFTVLEDASNTTKDYTNVFADVDDSSISKSVHSNNNTDLVSASISGNTLTLDYEDNQYGTATITVRGTSNSNTVDDAFVVTVTAVNDEPSFTKGSDQSVNEDAGAQTVSGWASSLSKGSGDPSSQSLSFTVTNNNNSLFSTQPAINSSGVLTYTSATNASGSSTVSVVLADDGGTANSGDDTYATQTFTIAVNAVDDAPTVANAIADFAVTEDASNSTIDLTNTFTDVDNNDSDITKVILSNGNTSLVSASISGNTLTLDYEANQSGTAAITIRATSNGKTVDEVFVVTVNAADDSPTVANAIADFTVLEDASNSTVDYSNVFTDGDNNDDDITKAVQSNNNTDLVSASISGNALTLDYVANQYGTATINIRGTSNGETVDDAFVVTVTGVNDEPSFTKGSNVSVNEDAGAQTASGWASNISKGTGDPSSQSLTFTTSNNNNSLFSSQPAINASGVLTFTSAANATGTATVSIVLTDDGGTANSGDDTYSTQTFTITVNNVNDAPTDLASSNTTAGGGDAANTFIGNLTATDLDDETHTFTISSGKDGAKFKIVDGTKLYTNAEMVYDDQPYTLDIVATDDDGATYEKELTINVTDNNSLPVVTSSQTFTIAENASNGTAVSGNSGAIAATDADGDGLSNWTIVSGNDAGKFALNASSGVITVAGGLDYETTTSYTLTVKVSDGSVFSATKTITINVTDINDLAPVVVDSSFSINENVASGTSVGTPRATDGDGSSTTFSGWTITSGNAAGKFAINSSTGAITTAASVNHEETSSYTLGITVSDGTNTSSAGTINIAINDLNEKPVATAQSITVSEDATDVVITLASSDPDGDVISTYTITSISTDGTLKQSDDSGISSNNTNVTSSAKQVKFTPDENFYGTITYNFTVTDPGSLTSEVVSVTITVPNTDDAPTVANSPSDVTVNEDADNTVIDLSNVINDVDNDNTNISFSLVSKGDESIVASSLSGKTLTLDFQDNKNTADGNMSIIYRATSNGLTVDDTIVVTVNPVDDGPTVANLIDDIAVSEDASNSTIDLSLVFTDIDNNDSDITPSVLSNNNSSLITTSISGKTLTLSFQNNQNGTAELVIRGTSNGKTADDTFEIVVNAVDDAPTVANAPSDVTVNEDAENTVIDLSNVINDIDNENTSIQLSLVDKGNESIVAVVLSDNVITLDFQDDKNTGDGNMSIIYRATSNGLTVDDTIVVTVNPVDDSPVVANAISDLTVTEDADTTLIDLVSVFTDIDNDDTNITKALILNSNSDLVTHTLVGNDLNLIFDTNSSGVATIVIEGTSNGKTVNDTLIVTVTPVDDAPTIANALSDVVIDEDADDGVISIADLFTDIDNADDSITVRIQSNDNISIASINIEGDSITFDLIDNQFGVINLIVEGTSNGKAILDTFKITITPINDIPIVLNKQFELNEDSTQVLILEGSDIEADSLTFKVLSLPKNGILSQSNGVQISSVPSGITDDINSLIYKPKENFFGKDSIFFNASDPFSTSENGVVQFIILGVNDPPIANNDTINIDEDETKTIQVSGTDLENDPLSFSITSLPSAGLLYQTNDGTTKTGFVNEGDRVFNSEQKVIYTPNPNEFGIVNFGFITNDGELTDSAEIIVNIASVPDQPIAENINIVVGAGLIYDLNVSPYVSDPDGDIIASSLNIKSNSGSGAVGVRADTSFIVVLNYSSIPDYVGLDSIEYEISDGTLLNSTGKIYVTVKKGRKPIAFNDTIRFNEDYGDTLVSVLSNDTDEDGDIDSTLTIIQSFIEEFNSNANNATVDSDSLILVEPAPDYFGTDNLIYSFSDETGLSDSATLVIEILPVEDAPIIFSTAQDTINLYLFEDTPLDFELIAFDADGDTLNYALCDEPKYGYISLPGEEADTLKKDVSLGTGKPSIQVNPEKDYNGYYTFKYCVTDKAGNIATAVVTVSVVSVPDPPIALTDSIEIFQTNKDTINIVQNDYDVENDIEVSTLRIYGDNTPGSATAIPTFGGALATVYEDSSLIIDYSNLQQFFGEDSLIYSICDETELCDTTTVIINVEQDQLPPDIYNILTDKDTVLYKVDDVTISASVKDSIPLQDVSLFVSEGGKNSFQPFNLYNINAQSSPVDQNSLNARYVDVEQLIDTNLITLNGLQYYFSAKDILGFGSQSGLSSVPIKIPEGSISIDECIPGDTWVLISIPSDLDNKAIESVFYNSFGKIDKNSFVIYTYENGTSVEASSIQPGKSYFIYKKGDPVCDFSLGSGIVDNVDTLEWILEPGWNFVGNPYPFTFLMGDVSQIEYCGPLTYTGTNAWSGVVDTVKSFGGYIICNKADTTRTLRVGITQAEKSGSQIANLYNGIFSFDNKGEWNAKVDFYTNKDADLNNNAGFHPEALNEYDGLDNPAEPYTPDGEYGVRFDWIYKHEANGKEYPLRDDIRMMAQNEGLWYGLLRSKEENINVKVDVQGNLKEGHALILFDLTNQKRFDLNKENNFELKNDTKTDIGKRIYLIYGDQLWVETKIAELISLIPKEFVLNDNYPNPFNPITTIKYEIPNDGKVLLVIYNLLGQEVITLINNEQWAGKYSVRWNGTNQFGNQVSTGTYFYFLKTQNNQSVKKMLLLK